MLKWVAAEMSKLLIKYDGRTLKLSDSRQTDLCLIAAVEELYQFWKNCTCIIQVAILQDLAACQVQSLVLMHRFFVEAYLGMLLYMH